jgi:glycosyltransferase involved in cell wall biosynthesis
MSLTVFINAGPWLPVPPSSYGGVENMLGYLIPELRQLGHRVLLGTVRDSRIEVDEQIGSFQEGQLRHIAAPYCDAAGIAHAHMQDVVEAIRTTPSIDIVHDILEVVGPSTLAMLGPDCPPILHTLQWNLSSHADFYRWFKGNGRVFFNGISGPQMKNAVENIRCQTLDIVPNGVDVDDFIFQPTKDEYFITLARFSYDKGQDIAARICTKLGVPLKMAGTVAGVEQRHLLDKELEDSCSSLRYCKDVMYYQQSVRPYEGNRIEWIGSVGGEQKKELVAGARALLMPLRWEEPFGMAVIEALASGTPVVAMKRGAMPVIIEHGINGFLADTEDDFVACVQRVDEIDPWLCRKSVERNFSARQMAEQYATLYQQVIAVTNGRADPSSAARHAGWG